MNGKQEQIMDKRNESGGQAEVQEEVGSAWTVDGQKSGEGSAMCRPQTGEKPTARRQHATSEPTDNRLEELWKTARELKPDAYKKQAAFREIRDAIGAKRIRNTPAFSELLRIQLQYISPAFWALQGTLLLTLILFLHRMSSRGAELAEYLWWSSITAAWMGVLSQGMLGKHFSDRMAELEQSCYINLTQMWTIRMILTTGADIAILTAFSGGIAAHTDTFFGRIAVYLLVPFVLSNICCLSLISALRGSRGKYAMTVLAVVTAMLAVSPSVFPEIYTAAYLWVWFCLLLFGAAVFAGQVRSCYGRMIRGDLICLN